MLNELMAYFAVFLLCGFFVFLAYHTHKDLNALRRHQEHKKTQKTRGT